MYGPNLFLKPVSKTISSPLTRGVNEKLWSLGLILHFFVTTRFGCVNGAHSGQKHTLGVLDGRRFDDQLACGLSIPIAGPGCVL